MDIDQLGSILRRFVLDEVLEPLAWPRLDDVLASWFERHNNPWHATTDVLPCLTCAAAGGSAESALPLAGFWLLYFFASKVFDSVQDGDEQHQPWLAGGSSEAISLGLALIATGNASLSGIADSRASADILRAFGRTWSLAAKSQADPQNDLSLEGYFANIIASTGEIFATAAWSGARIATEDASTLATFSHYGLNTGIRLAIISDCHGLQPDDPRKPSDVAVGIYKLPVIYAMSLKDHPQHAELTSFLTGNPLSEAQTKHVLSLLTEMRAVEWSLRIADHYRQRAVDALESQSSIAIDRLVAYAS